MIIALCCDSFMDCQELKNHLATLCDIPVLAYFNMSEFASAVADRPDTIMIVARTGTHSAVTASDAAKCNPGGKLVWFCDLDFALLSFRLKSAYFGLLPVDNEKLKTALSYCGILSTDAIL